MRNRLIILAVVIILSAACVAMVTPITGGRLITELDARSNAIVGVDFIRFTSGAMISNSGRGAMITIYETNAVIVTNHVNVTNNLSTEDVGGFVPSVKLGMDRLLWQKGDTNTQWTWWDSQNRKVNTNCWAYPVDFSGMSVEEEAGQTLTLVTRQHAVTCAHSVPSAGQRVVWSARDGSLVTNFVQSVWTGTNDVAVVILSSLMPDSVSSFPILPASFTNLLRPGFIAGGSWYHTNALNLEVVTYRPNSGRMNQKVAYTQSGAVLEVRNRGLRTSVFSEPDITTGDSGGPAFVVVDGMAVFLFPTSADHYGPWIGLNENRLQIEAVIETNLSKVNLKRFQTP